jgi:hypothetical protein
MWLFCELPAWDYTPLTVGEVLEGRESSWDSACAYDVISLQGLTGCGKRGVCLRTVNKRTTIMFFIGSLRIRGGRYASYYYLKSQLCFNAAIPPRAIAVRQDVSTRSNTVIP